MSEEQADYLAENGYISEAVEMLGSGYEKAAVIERPRKTHAIGDKGLEEYQLYGWVKMSAKFCAHIKNLKGAKLAIWLCLALSIDEDGECKLSQKELCALTGYSHTEVIESVKELDEMGFLSVDRSGKRNLYSPVFVAKGKGNSPSKETLVKKLDSTPLDSNESSPLLENSVPTSIKKEQEYISKLQKRKADLASTSIEASIWAGTKITEEMVSEQRTISEAQITFEKSLGFSRPLAWTIDKDMREFSAWVVDIYKADPKAFERFEVWRNTPFVKGSISNQRIRGFVREFYDAWDMFKKQDTKKSEPDRASLLRTL